MAEYGRRRSPAKRVSWETGIEGSNPSLSAIFFIIQKYGEISHSAEGREVDPPTRIFPLENTTTDQKGHHTCGWDGDQNTLSDRGGPQGDAPHRRQAHDLLYNSRGYPLRAGRTLHNHQ